MENDGQQQDSEYRQWLADTKAQAEYQQYLDDRELFKRISKAIEDFDWLMKEDGNEQDSSGIR